MIKARYEHYLLHFKEPAITSRQTMTEKETFFITLYDEESPSLFGVGEAALFRGLGADDRPDYEACLESLCRDINEGILAIDRTPGGSFTLGEYRHPYSNKMYVHEGSVTDQNISDPRFTEPMLEWER